MSVQIPTTSPPNDEHVRTLADAIGCELPQDYVDFVMAHDGAEPESNSVALADNESGVRRFVPVQEAATLITEIYGFPDGVVPLAEDSCGNYFYVDPRSGGVHFWDHEVEGSDELIAADLGTFLERLSPFDVSDVKLAFGQVRHAWIDPDFKKRFEN